MLSRRLSYTQAPDWEMIRTWQEERRQTDSSIEEGVRSILSDVRQSGDAALSEYSRRFDCPDFDISRIKATPDDMKLAAESVDPYDLEVIAEAAGNIRSYHDKQREQSWIASDSPDILLGQLIKPVQRAGLYIPGGQSGETPLVSSLLMTAIPAQAAGVGSLHAVTPPRRDGTINPYTLAAAWTIGLDNVYALGSAWAVAALAYGTESIPRVDMIAGPGNIYVTTAKRLLVGQVGIDMIAGPSEIVILADRSADPEWLAADLLSQAEHDPLSSAVLISDQESLLERTEEALGRQIAELPRSDLAEQAIRDWGAFIQVPDLATGIELIDRLAPEHLELCLASPWDHVWSISNAGAIFLGHFSPEPVGDYFAGPNHVLPTVATARFSSPLSVQDFYTRSSLLAAEPGYLRRHGQKIARLARLEGLEAHARSTEHRLQGNEP
jgi:histidinol dehydrogenase